MLSPENAVVLRAEGFDVVHVRDRGLLGAADAVVFERCVVESRAVVTANASDYRALAAAAEIHPGVILLRGDIARADQLRLLRLVVQVLDGHDLTNEVATVAADGTLGIEDLPRR